MPNSTSSWMPADIPPQWWLQGNEAFAAVERDFIKHILDKHEEKEDLNHKRWTDSVRHCLQIAAKEISRLGKWTIGCWIKYVIFITIPKMIYNPFIDDASRALERCLKDISTQKVLFPNSET